MLRFPSSFFLLPLSLSLSFFVLLFRLRIPFLSLNPDRNTHRAPSENLKFFISRVFVTRYFPSIFSINFKIKIQRLFSPVDPHSLFQSSKLKKITLNLPKRIVFAPKGIFSIQGVCIVDLSNV